MALSPTVLSGLLIPSVFSKIQLAFPEMSAFPDQLAQQQKLAKAIAEGVAEAIVPYFIANAQVVVAPGIPVATVGGPAAQTGATTGPGTGLLT